MLKITLQINNNTICELTAVRQEELTDENKVYTYLLNDGQMVKHKYSDGVFELAKEILNKIQIKISDYNGE